MRFRWLRRIIVILLGLLAAAIGSQYALRWQARRDLDRTIVKLDVAEPRWRLDAIEADRRAVKPEENAASVVRAAFALLPQQWDHVLSEDLDDVPPPCQLPGDLAEDLDRELRRLDAAVVKAR